MALQIWGVEGLPEVVFSCHAAWFAEGSIEIVDASAIEDFAGPVDDHSLWLRDIRRAASLARGLAAVVFLLIAGAAGAVVAFATRAGLAAQRQVVEVLHLTGAEDRFIASLFQAQFARVAAIAGLIGALGAALTGTILRLLGGSRGLTPALPVAWADLLALLPCPLLAAGVAAVAARVTARALIRGME